MCFLPLSACSKYLPTYYIWWWLTVFIALVYTFTVDKKPTKEAHQPLDKKKLIINKCFNCFPSIETYVEANDEP